MTTSVAAIGEGTLLSPESHRAQTEKALAGFGSALPGCVTCRTLTSEVSYGLGIWLVRDQLLQTPVLVDTARSWPTCPDARSRWRFL